MAANRDNGGGGNKGYPFKESKPKVRKIKNLRRLPNNVLIVDAGSRHLFAVIKEGEMELREAIEDYEEDDEGLKLVRYVIDESSIPPLTFPVVEVPKEEVSLPDEDGENVVLNVAKTAETQLPEVKEEELYKDIVDFLRDHLWFPDERIYYVLTSWILATYIAHLFPVYTYVLFIGPYGSGKSRALECLKELAFNALMVSSVSAAAVPALIEGWRATLLVDEGQLMNRDDRAELIAILNEGYRKDGVYARASKDGYNVRAMKVGGFKAIAAPEALTESLHIRAIEIPMIALPPNLGGKLRLTVNEEGARNLRVKLFSFMVRHFNDKPDYEELAKEVYEKGITDRRLIETTTPLYYVTPKPYKEKLVNFLKDLSKRRQEERTASWDADLLGALIELRHEVRGGKLLLKRVTNALNERLGLDEKRGLKPQQVGRLLKKFGFRKARINEGVCIIYDEVAIAEWASRYGLELPEEWRNYSLNLVRESNQKVSGVKCEESEDSWEQKSESESQSACKLEEGSGAGDHAERSFIGGVCSLGSSLSSHFTQHKREVKNSNLTLRSQTLLLKQFIELNQPVPPRKLDEFMRKHGIGVDVLKEAVRADLVKEDGEGRWWSGSRQN